MYKLLSLSAIYLNNNRVGERLPKPAAKIIFYRVQNSIPGIFFIATRNMKILVLLEIGKNAKSRS